MNAKADPPTPDIATIRLRNYLILSALALMLIGWVMLIDVGMVYKGVRSMTEYHAILTKRGEGMVLGAIAFFFLWLTPPKNLRPLAPYAALLGLLLLGLYLRRLERRRGEHADGSILE